MMRRLLSLLPVLLLAAAEAQAARESVIARLIKYEGALEVVRLGIPIALYPNSPLFSGDTLLTKEGRAWVRFNDRSEIRVKPHSRLIIDETADRRDIDVFFGRLWAYVRSGQSVSTNFMTGGTIAAVRGTDLEYAAETNGSVQVGVNTGGPVEVTGTLPDGKTADVTVQAGQWTKVPDGGPPSAPEPFTKGAIAGSGDTAPEEPVQAEAPAATPETVSPPEPAAPAATVPAPVAPAPTPDPTMAPPPESTPAPVETTAVAPAAAEPVVEATTGEAPAEPTPVPDCPENSKQGVYALQVIFGLGITSSLPPNATAKDAMELLANLGVTPAHAGCDCQNGPQCECGGNWQADACVRIEDLLCITGVDPCDPNAPAAIPLDELIDKILSSHSELFWIQARKKLTVSPFAP